MQRAPAATNLSRYPPRARAHRRPAAARRSAPGTSCSRARMSDDPTRHGTFDDVIARAALRPRPRLRRALLPADPSDRHGRNRKGRNNTLTRRPGRSRQPLCDRLGGGRPRRDPSRARHASRISRRLVARGARARAGDRARLRHPVLARPSLDQGAPGMVRLAAGRHDQVRREPAEEVRGHRQRPLLRRRAARRSGTRCATSSCSGCEQGRADLPRRQPAHQAVPVLGMDDRARCRPSIPDAIFLAEAFTRPKMMKRLAKVGFTQSYTYFTWRNTKAELTEYLTELTHDRRRASTCGRTSSSTRRTSTRSTCRPAAAPGFRDPRLALAATLSAATTASIPASSSARRRRCPGKEEYLDSEKYEIRAWDWDRPGNIRDDIALLNRHPARAPGAAGLHATSRSTTPGTTTSSTTARRRRTRTTSCCSASTSIRTTAQGCDFEVPLWEFGLPDDGHDRGRGSAARQPLHLARQDPAHAGSIPHDTALRDLAAHRRRRSMPR